MADVFTKKKRSEIMSRIKGGGNQTTELRLIDIFKAHKITGWRRKQAVFGRPDFVFRSARLAVFVDGCFWHGCSLHRSLPSSNKTFWAKKIKRNKERDKVVVVKLRQDGWEVLRLWEHDVKSNPKTCVSKIASALKKKRRVNEF